MSRRQPRIGILGAMPEEVASLVAELKNVQITSEGRRKYHAGQLWGTDVVVAFSGWGKVSAATTATQMIASHQVGAIVFTGVAGALAPGLPVGEVVVGQRLLQHDLDARPLFKQYEVPGLGIAELPTDPDLTGELVEAAERYLGHTPRVGEILSGDQFIASREKVAELRQRRPEALCVEMEGAAVAQVCLEYSISFGILRTISDAADEHAHLDFPKFLREVACRHSHGILQEWLSPASTAPRGTP